MDCRELTTEINKILDLNQALFADFETESFDPDKAVMNQQKIDDRLAHLVVELEKTYSSPATVEQAARIFGDHFFGFELADKLLGEKKILSVEEIMNGRKARSPEFSLFELLRAYNEGAKLVWRRQKDSNDKIISGLDDLTNAVEKVKAETGLEIEIVDNGIFVNFALGQGWALIYDIGGNLSYREQFFSLEEIAKEKAIDFSLMQGGRERIVRHKKGLEEIIRLEGEGKQDESNNFYSGDDLNNVMRPSVMEMLYDFLMTLMQDGSIPTGEFWTSTVADRPVALKVKKSGKVTIELVEKDALEAGPEFVMQRIDGIEKFNKKAQ